MSIDIPRTGRPFPDTTRRVAGVNSFGFGGTNAHVVLAEPPRRPAPTAWTMSASYRWLSCRSRRAPRKRWWQPPVSWPNTWAHILISPCSISATRSVGAAPI